MSWPLFVQPPNRGTLVGGAFVLAGWRDHVVVVRLTTNRPRATARLV
jgi:hypothetical protein